MSRGKQTDQVAFDQPGGSKQPPAGERARRWLVVVAAIAATAVVAAAGLLVEYRLLAEPAEPPRPQRIHAEVTAVDAGGRYRFVETARGAPVAYSPCRTIRLVVNDRLMPRRAKGLAEDAVERVVAATGLDLRISRTAATVQPRTMRSLRFSGPEVRRAPVRLSWTTPRREPALAGDVVGVSASATSTGTGRPQYVTGAVSLDARALRNILALPGGRALVRAVIMRELAHLVGLDHVNDPNELMNRDNVGLVDFGPGDREGLALLGQGPCV